MLPNFSRSRAAHPESAKGTRFASWRAAAGITAAACLWLSACAEPNLPQPTPDRVEDRDVVEFLPVPAVLDGQPRTLLQEMAARPQATPKAWDAEQREWVLPYKTKRIDVVLIMGVAFGDEDLLARVLAPHAEWGLPDRRMIGAQPIYGPDGGERFFQALHRAAMRFPENAEWKSQVTLDGPSQMYATGAEPMWTYYQRENDWIVFRKSTFQGRPVIDYVGLWPAGPPSAPFPIAADFGPPPPLAPPIDRRMIPPMPEMAGGPPGRSPG